MTSKTVPVMVARLLDPGQARLNFSVDAGTTVADIVARSVPAFGIAHNRVRVLLVSDTGVAVVPQDKWQRVRPMPGIQVVVRTIPGKDTIRSVLLAVVSVAAMALTGPVASLLGLSGSLATNLVTAGLTVVGTLLVNALIPVQVSDVEKKRNVYAINGWQNELRAGSPVPYGIGAHRYAPPYAAKPWTEVVGDEQYIRALFTFGYGPLRISELKIGETSIDDYDDVDIEIREGRAGDLPVSLYPQQVLEEGIGVDLIRPYPRDAAGEILDDDPSISTPVVRFTASDTAQTTVILGFPAGLFRVDNDGDLRSQTVSIKIEERLNGVGSWSTVTTLDVSAKKRESILRQHNWSHASRGRWQIRVTRITPETTDAQVSDRTTLQAIQSIRPEYPVNIDKPISLVAVRIRATYQLNGTLDSLNGLIEREGPQHDGGNVWSDGYGSNPATGYLLALTSPLNPYPVAEADIDMDLIADWYDWCALKGLKYDRVHDQSETLSEMLASICAAGRATPRHDGIQWGVVIDRPQSLVIDHINPRNAADFQWERSYFDAPDGFRVPFLDATNDYQPAERIVPWPGHVGDIVLTEELILPGKTDPDEIWFETRRKMYELEMRPDTFSAIQDGASRVATRGDQVMTSSDVLQSVNSAARVKSIDGALVEIDELTKVEIGYGMRFRVYANSTDAIGTSVLRKIAPNTSSSTALRLIGSGPMPTVGEAVHIGPLATESLAMRVRGVEAAENFGSRLIMVAAAPEIDEAVEAEVPPAWDGRVGEVISASTVTPAVPVFTLISSFSIGVATPALEVLLRAGRGSVAIVTSFEVDHRIVGGSWSTVTVPAASGGCSITGYEKDDDVELRARAISTVTPSNYTETVSHQIGADDADIPQALDIDGVVVLGGLGRASLSFVTGADLATKRVQIYRAPTGVTLDRGAHAVGAPISTALNSTFNHVDGDATRTNILNDPDFNSGSPWVTGTGWSISAGKAVHVGPTGGNIEQSVSLVTDKVMRLGVELTARTAGILVPRLTGTTTASAPSMSAIGLSVRSLTVNAGNDTLALAASSTFDGSIEQVYLFKQTASCAPQGTFDYYLEPQSDDGLSGPAIGPFTTTIV